MTVKGCGNAYGENSFNFFSIYLKRFSGDTIMNRDDPTDHALAAIASIFDKPQNSTPDENSVVHSGGEVDGYTKFGPGPIDAIRVKWMARAIGNGMYVVDETVGENATPFTSPPMSGDSAIKFIDERERDAHQRFAQLQSEMTGRVSRENPAGQQDSKTVQ
jgi:hypothetical protein